MLNNRPVGRGLAISAQLALVAFLSIGLTTTTHDSVANTLSSVKVSAVVTAPSKEDLAAAEQAYRLDMSMQALSPQQAALYRGIFVAHQNSNWVKADHLIADVSDKRLMGHVWADRIERQAVSSQVLIQWLTYFPTLPDAQAIYAKAKKAGVKNPPHPQAPENWSGGADIDGAANFMPERSFKNKAYPAPYKKLVMAVQKALRKGHAREARDLLVRAQFNKDLSGMPFSDLQAIVAASFFSVGERGFATSLSESGARAGQPLGLWIRGLIAWEKKDDKLAQDMFSSLAAQPDLSKTNRAAAHFWAYRVFARQGDDKAALKHLIASASVPRSFYGLLASQLLGRDPISSLANTDDVPVWGSEYRDLLAENQAGWRALALIQVGQKDRAEAELRRLSPQGDNEKKRAMLALASHVSMPALVLRLASLSKGKGFDPSFYPLLPWTPKEGFQIDRALLFALARHESMFDPSAVSFSGAQGLLQIMPATAKAIAATQDDVLAIAKQDKLFDPTYNMTLGQRYVQRLVSMPQIGKNLLFLLASYNAGPSKAAKWIEGKESSDPLLFMESIPVRETRNYVARVLPHYWAYRARLGRPTPSLQQMAEGQWPSFTLRDDATVHVALAQ